jgi:hypothetical protein
MTDRLHITDHALLGWMERCHGLDIATWRNLMRDEAEAALRQFEPALPPTGASFVVSAEGKVVGFCEDGFRSAYQIGRNPLFIPRPVSRS